MVLTKALRSSQFNSSLHFHGSIITAFLTNNLTHHRTISVSSQPVNSRHGNEPTIKLSTLFSNKNDNHSGKRVKRDERVVYKELSPTMIEFSKYLYQQGYFDTDLSVFPNKMFDAACLRNVYGHNFLRHAAEKFGCKNQEIAKKFWSNKQAKHSSSNHGK